MSPSLVGPPEIKNPPPPQQPPLAVTENNSATLLATGNPCLDLFFHVVPDTPAESLTQRLTLAWSHNPLTTLKLICNLRGVRGTGKSDKNGFYTAAFWLHNNHPKTLASNLPAFAQFGYWKDFPEILFRVMGLTRPPKMVSNPVQGTGLGVAGGAVPMKKTKKSKKSATVRIRLDAIRQEKEQEVARAIRHEKKGEMAKKALEKYNSDPNYQFLHDRVSDLFAGQLKSDLQNLNSGECNKISLAAKWCPSLDSSFDKATLLCEAVARKVFPREEYKEYEGVEEAHYAYRVRDRLRKEVLVPLRKALELPEIYMTANKWSELHYNRVASVAMKTYKELFMKHDEERFKGYLEDVKSGKTKIAAGALLPHEIVESLDDGDNGEVAELQWKRMVEDMAKEGKMKNCIAVCDVSGSMSGTPMEVCVSLGLLLSELSEEPWKGKVITFSANPQMHLIKGDNLESKTEFIREMDWQMNTDLQKVFDLILNVAVQNKVEAEQMIKRVFVFSDMEFDQATGRKNEWETDYMVIKRKFEESGYGEAVPEIVFWNLRDSRSTPVSKDQNGVALVSGFSKNALKLFLDGKQEDAFNPESVMEAAISGEEYQKLVVLD